jgi:hypothetical protein
MFAMMRINKYFQIFFIGITLIFLEKYTIFLKDLAWSAVAAGLTPALSNGEGDEPAAYLSIQATGRVLKCNGWEETFFLLSIKRSRLKIHMLSHLFSA